MLKVSNVQSKLANLIAGNGQTLKTVNPVLVKPMQARKTHVKFKKAQVVKSKNYGPSRTAKKQNHIQKHSVKTRNHQKTIEQFKALLATNQSFLNKQFKKKTIVVLFAATTSDNDSLQDLVQSLGQQFDISTQDQDILQSILNELQEIGKSLMSGDGQNDLLNNLLFMLLVEALNEGNQQKGLAQILSRDDKFLEMLLTNGLMQNPDDAEAYEAIANHLNSQFPMLDALPNQFNDKAQKLVSQTLNSF